MTVSMGLTVLIKFSVKAKIKSGVRGMGDRKHIKDEGMSLQSKNSNRVI